MTRGRTVVFLAQGFSEPGGCASHSRKLAEGLARRGWDVHVIARLGSGRRLLRSRAPGLRVVEIPGFGRRGFGGLLFLVAATPWALLRRRPDALIAMQLASPATVASVSSRLLGRPFVVLSTSTGEAGEVAFVRRSRLRRARLALLRGAAVLVAQTGQGAEELADLLPGSRVEVVPTPVELPEHLPALRKSGTVVYSGRLVAGKNLDVLLDVWRRVVAERPKARLRLLGSGIPGDRTEADLRRVASEDPVLAGSVEFAGWVQDVTPHLRSTDVYVLPSASEGMSNGLLEACAHGRVVVASDIPANRAVLGEDYPLLVDVHDGDRFADALVRALGDARLRRAARRSIIARLDRFDVANVVAQMDALLVAAAR